MLRRRFLDRLQIGLVEIARVFRCRRNRAAVMGPRQPRAQHYYAALPVQRSETLANGNVRYIAAKKRKRHKRKLFSKAETMKQHENTLKDYRVI